MICERRQRGHISLRSNCRIWQAGRHTELHVWCLEEFRRSEQTRKADGEGERTTDTVCLFKKLENTRGGCYCVTASCCCYSIAGLKAKSQRSQDSAEPGKRSREGVEGRGSIKIFKSLLVTSAGCQGINAMLRKQILKLFF